VVKFFTLKELASIFLLTPSILVSVIARERKRGRLGDSLKTYFPKKTPKNYFGLSEEMQQYSDDPVNHAFASA